MFLQQNGYGFRVVNRQKCVLIVPIVYNGTRETPA